MQAQSQPTSYYSFHTGVGLALSHRKPGLHAVNLTSVELEDQASGASSWVLLARDEPRIRSLGDAAEEDTRLLGVRGALPPVRFPSAAMLAGAPIWTDDYSDLLGALRSQ